MNPAKSLHHGGASAAAAGDATGDGCARVYRTSPWLRGTLALGFSAFTGGAVAVGIFDVLPDRGMSIVLLMFAALSWYGWALVRRRRVIIDDRGITLVEWRKPLRLELTELRGYRRSYWGNAVNLHFETQKPGRPVPVRILTSMDAAFHAWLERIPELDAGAEPSAQRLAFDRDRPIARTINRVALAIGACSLVPIGYQPGRPGGSWVWVAALPFLAPLVAIGMVLVGRGRFTLFERGREDPRPTLFLTFFLPPAAAALRPINEFQTLSIGPVLAAGAVASAILCALAWLCDRTLRGRRALVLLLVLPLMTLPWSSAALVVNCAADDSPAQAHKTIVLRKIHRTGKGGGYFLELAPWEPTMQSEERRVSRHVFASARAGRPVSVLTKPGWLGFRWAWVE